jgi:hypothetical protein
MQPGAMQAVRRRTRAVVGRARMSVASASDVPVEAMR